LEIDPNNAQAWFEHGLYLGNFWANPEDNELVPEQQEKAVESFTRAIEFDASYYEAWLFKGITLYKSSHMAQAMQRASAAAGIEVPNSPNYFHESLESFDKAIGIDSFDTRAWIYKGKLLTELFNGYEKQSIEVFIKLTELQPEEAEHWYKLASVQHELNERQAVLNSLRKAISLDPELKEEAVRDFEDLANDKDFKEIVE
jgi:tetratricopeptide (TPR) repeat protein